MPVPEPGGLLVKVEAYAVCGTDLRIFLKGGRLRAGCPIGG